MGKRATQVTPVFPNSTSFTGGKTHAVRTPLPGQVARCNPKGTLSVREEKAPAADRSQWVRTRAAGTDRNATRPKTPRRCGRWGASTLSEKG